MSDMSSANNDSEDDDPRVHSSGMSSSGQPRRYELSKSELRKNNKPIMEKKRRARINQCLNELKTLILDALKKDPARHTKLEKADILEMTVRHLQSLYRSGGRPPAPPPPPPPAADASSSLSTSAAALTAVVVQKFQTGYQECAGEVNRFVSRLDGVDDDVKKQLTSHLESCVAKMRYAAAAASATPPPPPPPVGYHLHQHQHQHQQQEPRPLDPSVAAVLMPNGRPLLQLSHCGRTAGAASVPPPVGRLRASAFTAVRHGPATSDADRSPFVYCDEPAVSSTSSWAEDAVAANAATVAASEAAAVNNGPPLDFSTKTTAGGNKRPLGDIPVNVPTAAPSAHRKAAPASRDDDVATSPPPPPLQLPPFPIQRPADGPRGDPGSDPNMWRPW